MAAFTEWKGGVCPIPSGVEVEVRYRQWKGEVRLSHFLDWQHAGCELDIVGYRIPNEHLISTKNEASTQASANKELFVSLFLRQLEKVSYPGLAEGNALLGENFDPCEATTLECSAFTNRVVTRMALQATKATLDQIDQFFEKEKP